MPSFLDLGVPAALANVLAADGKTEPFAIQRDTLPDSLAGRDLLGRGRTGSGKTIAFALPLVARLAASASKSSPGRPRGLVLAPTRELASQIAATVTPLAAAVGLRVTTVFGGVSQRPQEQALRAGVDIVVACPGRLEDLMKQGIVSLGAVEIAVLDEADHMADLGFLPGVTRILSATSSGGQRLLFSATLDRGIDALAKRFLHNPVSHEVDEASVPVGEMTHRVLVAADADAKKKLVEDLASGLGRRILFTRTKHQAKKLAKQLTSAGIPSVDLHGNLGQNARERNLAAFGSDPADGGVRVLVATDVAARGVHVDDVELVVHVDPPVEHKAYLHRSGRTARAGAAGTVVTLMLPEQRRDVQDLLRKAAIKVSPEPASAEAVDELVGERAPHVKPAPPQQQSQSGKGGGRGSGSSRGRGSSPVGEQRSAGSSRRRASRGGSSHTADTPSGQGQRSQGQRSQGQWSQGQRAEGKRSEAQRDQPVRGQHAPRGERTQGGSTRPTQGAAHARPQGSRRATRPQGR